MFRRISRSNRTLDVYEFFNLIENGKWDKVRKLLRSDVADYSRCVDETGLTTLSISVSSYAPLDIIKTIIESHPESASQVDEYGASPLHLACLNGTNADVVRLIMAHDDGRTASVPDHQNYTALHHAVEYVCVLIENRYYGEISADGSSHNSIATEQQDYLEIIRILCQKCPETVHIATKDKGDTPLDIPQIIMMRRNDPSGKYIHHKRLLDVYELLKDASIRVYCQKKYKWENEQGKVTTSTNTTTQYEDSVDPSLISSIESQSHFRGSGVSFLSANVSSL